MKLKADHEAEGAARLAMAPKHQQFGGARHCGECSARKGWRFPDVLNGTAGYAPNTAPSCSARAKRHSALIGARLLLGCAALVCHAPTYCAQQQLLPPEDCVVMSTLIDEQCCERTPNLCAPGGGTPTQCTAECAPAFIDFWISSCHDSVLEGGAAFQEDLDRLMGQCLLAPVGDDRSAVPEMVHLARAGAGAEHADAVVVTWQTAGSAPGSDVGFRPVGVPGAGWRWTSAADAGGRDAGALSPQPSSYRNARTRYESGTVHRVVVNGLRPGVLYHYRVGDRRMASTDAASAALSPELGPYRHPVLRGSTERSQRVVIVGDLGQSSTSEDTLRQIAHLQPELIQLNGDLAYANGVDTRWDSWQRLIQPIASRIPVMVAAGNHDMRCSFPPRVGGSGWCNELSSDAYLTRFTMPRALDPVTNTDSPSIADGGGRNFFFSYDSGDLHVVVLCPYVLWGIDSAQYRWAAADLAAVDRSITPWLIVISHAPFYTSNLRHQLEGVEMLEVFEPLFLHYGVDAVASGHIHAYERTAPVTGGLLTGSVDPSGPVYLTVGCGGNGEGLYNYFDPRGVAQYPWMDGGYREAAYGYGELELLNSSTAMWRWHKLIPRFGSLTGGSELADTAAITHPPRAAALIAAHAAAAASGSYRRAACVVGDQAECIGEMRACAASAGCHPVWACMRATALSSSTVATDVVTACGEDSTCAQECFALGDPSGGLEAAGLAMCAQQCIEHQAGGNAGSPGGGHR